MGNYKAKLIVIGAGRDKLLYTCSATKFRVAAYVFNLLSIQDHHSKLHINFEGDESPLGAVSALAVTHTNLRFTLYFEHGDNEHSMYQWKGGKLTNSSKNTDSRKGGIK